MMVIPETRVHTTFDIYAFIKETVSNIAVYDDVIDHISQYTISVNMSNEDLHVRIPLKAYILTL